MPEVFEITRRAYRSDAADAVIQKAGINGIHTGLLPQGESNLIFRGLGYLRYIEMHSLHPEKKIPDLLMGRALIVPDNLSQCSRNRHGNRDLLIGLVPL